MFALLALAGCQDPLPQAFDWRIDRTLVPGLNLVPPTAEEGTARRIEALVLSPWSIDSVAVEVCGLVTDVPTRVYEQACFAEDTLVQKVADGVPATWTPPDLSYECEGYTPELPTGTDTGPLDTGRRTTDSGGYNYGCGSYAVLRVVVHTDEDEGSSSAPLGIVPNPVSGSPPDASLGDPQLELVEGEAVGGGEVRLRFSIAPEWDGDSGFRWYVDDGMLEGTGRTGLTGVLPSGRKFSDNTLDIPENYEGDLRVAVVTGSVPQLWRVLTLEVPVILLLAGCFGVFPFRNEAPRMTSFNGIPVGTEFGNTGTAVGFFEELLEEQPISMTIKDPERNDVTVWFPYLTGTIEFDQDTLEGVWRPDLDTERSSYELEVVLEDDRDPPARSEWFFYWVGDTG